MTKTINARPEPVNLALYAGDDLYLRIVKIDPDGNTIDFTGATAAAEIRATAADPVVLATFDTDVYDDEILLHLSPQDAAMFPNGAVWDAQVTYADGTVSTLIAGEVTITDEVTRP